MSRIFEFLKKYDVLILVILGILLYFQSLFYDVLSYDDMPYIIQNEYLNGNLSINFYQFFIPNFVRNDIYIPLTFIIYWSIIKVFGISSVAFHFVNILFYISSSIVLFYLLKKIINNYSIAFFATVLYILHPCHIECTVWISAMGYSIAVFFFYLSFLYFISAFDENKNINYIYSIIFYVLAILSQPIAVTLPAILFLWVYCFRKERLKESIKYISAYIPFLFIYLYLYSKTILATSRFEEKINYIFLDKISILGFNLFHSFIPVNLCPMQLIPTYLFIIPFLVIFILLYFFRKNIYYLFFCLFGLISILPYSNIFFNINIPVADRYLILFSVSSCVLLSYLSFYILERFKENIIIKYLSFIFFVFLYLFSFSYYLPVWRDDKVFWRYAYNKNSDHLYIVAKYSALLYREGEYDDALILIDNNLPKISKIKSVNWIFYTEYSLYKIKCKILIKKHLLNDSLNAALKLKELLPKYYETYFCLFDIYIEKKDYNEAIRNFKIADEICKKGNLYKKSDIFLSANRRKIILDFILSRPDEFINSFKIVSNDFKLLGDNGEFSKIVEKKDYKSREEICLNYLKNYNTEYSRYVINLLVSLCMQNVYKEKASNMMRILLNDMDKAEDFIKKGDNKSAEHIYLSIISKNKYMYIAYKNLGILYLQIDRKDKAKDIFMKMLEIYPSDNEVKRFMIDYLEN